jgi:hypothetical protein
LTTLPSLRKFPLDMDIDNVVRILRTIYTAGVVEYIASEHIHIRLPLSGSDLLHTFILSERQARYLVCNPITGDDLKAQRLPLDWPDFPS